MLEVIVEKWKVSWKSNYFEKMDFWKLKRNQKNRKQLLFWTSNHIITMTLFWWNVEKYNMEKGNIRGKSIFFSRRCFQHRTWLFICIFSRRWSFVSSREIKKHKTVQFSKSKIEVLYWKLLWRNVEKCNVSWKSIFCEKMELCQLKGVKKT